VFSDNIDPIKVFEIAKWKCHICGCNTPKELRGSYKHNAPELDHIITLAEGGTHAYTNVNCSCRKCNQAKGSRSYGQIKLF
jgi:5-methylcytosine-specific restriction endonuclease McrA